MFKFQNGPEPFLLTFNDLSIFGERWAIVPVHKSMRRDSPIFLLITKISRGKNDLGWFIHMNLMYVSRLTGKNSSLLLGFLFFLGFICGFLGFPSGFLGFNFGFLLVQAVLFLGFTGLKTKFSQKISYRKFLICLYGA